jgi:hypothetical protein
LGAGNTAGDSFFCTTGCTTGMPIGGTSDFAAGRNVGRNGFARLA